MVTCETKYLNYFIYFTENNFISHVTTALVLCLINECSVACAEWKNTGTRTLHTSHYSLSSEPRNTDISGHESACQNCGLTTDEQRKCGLLKNIVCFYCSLSVCLCVCLSVRDHISGTVGPIFTKFIVQIPCGRGLVLLWWRCATLCISVLWMTSRLAVVGRMARVWWCMEGWTFNLLPLAALRYRDGVWCLWTACLIILLVFKILHTDGQD